MQNINSLGGVCTSVADGNNASLPQKTELSRESRIDAEELKSRVSILDIYQAFFPEKFNNQKKGGKDLLVSCYHHGEDKNPSMALSESKNEYHCFGCDKEGDIYHLVADALGLRLPGDFPKVVEWVAGFTGVYVPTLDYHYEKPIPKVGRDRTVTEYDYGNGYTVQRIEKAGEKKKFHQFYEGRLYKKESDPQFPMYQQAKAATAATDGTFWISDHEGEKCVDFSWGLGYPSITPYGNLHETEYLPTYQSLKGLIGKPFGLVIFVDNDDKGREKADLKKLACESLGIPFKVVDWADHIPEIKGGDVIDYISANGEDKFRELVGKALSSPNKPKSNLIPLPSRKTSAIDPDLLQEEFLQFLETSPKASAVAAFKVKRALTPEQCKFLDLVKSEQDRALQVDDFREELEDLIRAGKSEINLLDYFPETFAKPLKQWAEDVKVPESCIMTVLLPCVARFLGRSEVLLSRRTNWKQPPNIFSCLVGASGSKKSPIFRAIAYDPIALLQETIDEEYQQKLEEYEAWQKLSKEEKENQEEPARPERFLLFLSNLTAETLHYLSETYPDKGQMILSDEISGYFANQNRYSSSGSGGDKEEILSYYDGQGQSVGRRSGMLGGRRFNLSIAGATQHEILHQLMQRRGTNTGEWARFLICDLPFTKTDWELEDSDIKIDFSPMLANLYKNLDMQPKQLYSLSPEAFAVHKKFCNYVEGLAVNENNPGLAKAYIKASGQVGRLALVLHCSVHAIAQVDPPAEIGLATMLSAEKLMRFYLGQAKRLYGIQEPDSVNPLLLKILEIAGTRGSASPGDVIRFFSGKKRPSQDLVKESMYQLQSMGLGKVDKSGKSVRFYKAEDSRVNVGNIGNVGKNVGKNVGNLLDDSNPLPTRVLEDEKMNVGNIGKFSGSVAESEKSNHSENNSGDLPTLPTFPEKKLEPLAGDDLQNVGKVTNIPPKITNIPQDLSTFPSPADVSVAEADQPQPMDESIRRMGLPKLVAGKKYKIMDGDRWVSATFLKDIQVPMGGQLVVAGLLFQFYRRSIRIDRADWVQA
jgi:hypothetical protein